MQFRSVADINKLLRQKLDAIPRDIDLIVGIPRSGMLPATLLALHLDLPLTDLEGFRAKRLLKSGTTRGQSEKEFSSIRHALVIDDSIFTGGTISAVRERLRDCKIPKITYCAVYGSESFLEPDVIVLEKLDAPRAFEWNIMYHPFILKNACIDLDGILCFDPSSDQNDGSNNYNYFLSSASIKFLPKCEVHSIVTSRLEKYRSETEKWLKQAGIRYKFLHMLDLPDEETRKRLGNHAIFKASVYKSTKNYIFIESEEWQAREIARISGRPALSLAGSPQIFYGSLRTPRGLYWHLRKIPILKNIFGVIKQYIR